jgi:hypothetical protein
VTLSDDEARRRGTQKTVLDRRAPPTFDMLVEIQSRNRLIIHEDVASAVDAHLRSKPLPTELRYREENGQIQIESYQAREEKVTKTGGRRERHINGNGSQQVSSASPAQPAAGNPKERKPIRAFVYGVARNRLAQSAKRLNVPLILVDEDDEADVMVTLKSYYRQRPRIIVDAERRGVSIYVLRANTVTQLEDFLVDLFGLESSEDDPFAEALQEVEDAIQQIRVGKAYVDLKPQPAPLRRKQHDAAKQAHLVSHSYGSEPYRYVRVIQTNTH